MLKTSAWVHILAHYVSKQVIEPFLTCVSGLHLWEKKKKKTPKESSNPPTPQNTIYLLRADVNIIGVNIKKCLAQNKNFIYYCF